jgi:flagellar hook-associated protein 1 FlgK
LATGDLLGVGLSALLANQRALATAGHNIANVNTEGYSRQRVEFTARPPQRVGPGYIGTGVEAGNVRRLYDGFLTNQVRAAGSGFARLDVFHSYATQVDNLFTDSQTSLLPALGGFFDSVQDVANDPASIAARQTLLGEAETLVSRFQSLHARLADIESTVNARLEATVTEINDLAQSIAALNQDIVLAARGGASANDLLDQRDQLITTLATKVSVSTVPQDDGAINVFVGNGQTLVLGAQAFQLAPVDDPLRPSSPGVGYLSTGTTADISGQISGGELGGLLEFRSRVLDPAFNSLGQIAQGLAYTFNAVHNAGLDLNGMFGSDFFLIQDPEVIASARNTGTGSVQATVADGTALGISDYLARYDGGGNWTVTRLTDNVSQSWTGATVFDGINLSAAGAAAVGDTFLVRPTRASAQTISVAIQDPRDIAAAVAVRTETGAANTGTATISAGAVLDPTDPNLLATITLNFVDANNYQINGAGPLMAYVGGADVDIDGWRVRINGSPAAGDSFSVLSNVGGVGDNRNVLNLGQLQTKLLLNGGSAGFGDAYGQLLGRVGSTTRSAELNRDAQAVLRDHAVNARAAVSGVNLDEEASNLLRFQQAYQAATQIINVANDLFDSLLAAIRR